LSFNPPPGKGCFTINAIVVDIGDHTIRTGKTIRRIEPKAMHVLYLLACNAGDTVERAELLRDIWNGRVVVEEALTRIISQLRQALGDSQQRRLIQTVPKKGYRLRGEVNWQSTPLPAEPAPSTDSKEAEVADIPAQEAVEPPTDSAPAKQPEPQKVLSPAPVVSKKALFVAAVLTVLVAVVVFTLNKTATDDTPQADEQRISVAVLPLRQLSNDDDTLYFADGITEELTDSLTQNQNLDVPSRYSTLAVTSSQNNSLSDVASSLGVRYLVEGSVRRIDEEFKIAVRLIDADTDRVVWSESYTNTASSLFAIQQNIARRLNEALLPQTSDNALAQASSPDNIEAYQYYLRGNYWLMNGKTSEWTYKSEAAFQQAVALAPDFAAAHGKLAYLYARHDFHDAFMPREEALQKASAAISTALRNNPQETNALLASVIIDTASLLGDTPQARFWQGLQRFTEPQQTTDVARQLMLELPLLDNRIFSLLPLLYQNYLQAGDSEEATRFLQSRIADTAPQVNVHNYRFYAALQALTPLPDNSSKALRRLMTTIGDNAVPLLIYPLLNPAAEQALPDIEGDGWLDYYWLINNTMTASNISERLQYQRQQAALQRQQMLPLKTTSEE
tara:strand:- start:4919 stop:6775 length:1857 start_codon:yes stop_codon:yes gene_type:complete